jgi:hypothetical protein
MRSALSLSICAQTGRPETDRLQTKRETCEVTAQPRPNKNRATSRLNGSDSTEMAGASRERSATLLWPSAHLFAGGLPLRLVGP